MDLKDLIDQIDIVEYISQYIDLEQRGEEWWGLSCFKDERTPSFSIRRDPPFFYDYSSGIGGNIYTFVRKYFNCSTIEAVNILKNYLGYDGEVTIPKGKLDSIGVMKRYVTKERNEKQSSGIILPEDYMVRYEKRKDKLQVWRDDGIAESSLEKFQVKYDSFSDRLVYPIRDMNGEIVNIGGRALAENWKEDGQRKYCYFFSWGAINTIYGVPENMKDITEKREVILFEGCKSVLLADTWGIHNTGAILTSHLSTNQMIILAKLGVDVVFGLDKDVNIREDKNIQKLKNYVNVFYLYDANNLLSEKDAPVDKGKGVFEDLYRNRRRLK